MADAYKTEALEGAGAFAVTAASQQVLDADTSRVEVTIVNDSDTVVYLGLGEAAVVGSGIRINNGGGSWTSGQWRGSVFAIHGGSGSKNISYVEF